MSLEKIISIPGMGGLFKMVAQMRNGGFVVESLADQKRFPVSSTQRIVMLEDISVYTMEGDMPLKDVLLKMKEKDELCSKVDVKADPAELKATLKKVVPDFDEDRVHSSDIKKMFTWYGLLKDIIEKDPEPVEEKKSESQEEKEEEKTAVKKPAARKTTKAKAKTEEAKDDVEAAEKKPKAKKTAKKKSED